MSYKAQRSRGHEGFGFFTPNNNRLTHNVDERGILRLLNRTKQSEILFHHRFPTSTANVRNACHPFSTKDRYKHNYVGVHNGVLWNDDIVAKQQMAEGVSYVSKQSTGSFNDSEVLIYDLADVIEGRKDKLSVEGSIAFIVVQLDKKGNRKALYFGRNTGNPLKIKKYKHGFSLTSEGDGEMIDPNKLFRYDYKTGKFSATDFTIPYRSYTSNYGYSGGRDYEDYDYGDYRGYNSGYDWKGNKETGVGYDAHGNKIDQNGYLVPTAGTSGVFTEQVLDRYKSTGRYGAGGFEETEKQAVKEIVGALLYDMNYANEVALEFGTYLLDELQGQYLLLEDMFRQDLDLTGQELDEYLELDEKIRLLTLAIDQLADKQMKLALTEGMRNLTV